MGLYNKTIDVIHGYMLLKFYQVLGVYNVLTNLKQEKKWLIMYLFTVHDTPESFLKTQLPL